jgi:hypothetical protein
MFRVAKYPEFISLTYTEGVCRPVNYEVGTVLHNATEKLAILDPQTIFCQVNFPIFVFVNVHKFAFAIFNNE